MRNNSYHAMGRVHWLRISLLLLGWFGLSQMSTLSQSVSNQSVEITVRGIGAVLADDVAKARDKAIEDAMRRAVEHTLTAYLDPELLEHEYTFVDERILSWASGYVSGFVVNWERQGKFHTYEIELRTRVNLDDLRRDHEAVRELLMQSNPKVMIVVPERLTEEAGTTQYLESATTAAEGALTKHFRSSGFEVVEAQSLKSNYSAAELVHLTSTAPQQLQNAAAAAGAELLVLGSAEAQVTRTGLPGNLKACEARVTTRVIRVDNNEPVTFASQEASLPYLDAHLGSAMAIEQAAEAVAKSLEHGIVAEARKRMYDGNRVELHVAELQDPSALQELGRAVQSLFKGVRTWSADSLAGRPDHLTFQIAGSAAQLARALNTSNLAPRQVEVLAVRDNRLDIRIGQENFH